MTKQEAVSLFGSQAALGRALGVSRQMIHQLPADLPSVYIDRLLGACVRLRKPIPADLLAKVGQEKNTPA